MPWVGITTCDPRYWDDGPEKIIGPFETREDAETFFASNPQGQTVEFWELTPPDEARWKLQP